MSTCVGWRGKGFSFFQNRNCEYFPCHSGVETEQFNCLFCFCPLYGCADCGGAYTRQPNGLKDCDPCVFPHKRDNYGLMMERLNGPAEPTRE